MSFTAPPSHLFLRGLAVLAVAFVALGVLIAPELLSQPELLAAPAERPRDPDGDGLVNQQEAVLGTNAFQADTDGDRFSDLEEVARKSSPYFAQSTPSGDRLRVGMSCRGGAGELHALIAFYLPDGNLRSKSFKAGVLVGGRTIALSQEYLLTHAKFASHSAQAAGARLVTLDLPISPRFVRYFGHMSVFATLGDAAQGIVQAADSVHLLAIGPTIVLQMPDPRTLGASSMSGSGQQPGGSGAGDIGSIYVPLSEGEPGSWTAGQVCVQQTVVIGTSGATITHEVVSAECQDGWDGYCPSSCAGTVGNTYTTIDPLALIGG